ncbi:MAG: carotenoid 1,2-hydratase, partial [Myxococcaceae bacterium]|nr:carotenoid 1,2-hydratase [Myxococcaceae bacterium]
MNTIQVPEAPGSYRWYYVDVTHGEHTVVAIFMIGSLFSSRYAASPRASPRQHAAVNFAVYEGGVRRAWVLSEYAALDASERSLGIGRSTLSYTGERRLELNVRERTVHFGRELEANVTLDSHCPKGAPLVLVPGLGHRWHPIAPLATAKVEVPSLGLTFEGHAYHDGNDGDVPLGTDLAGWDWERRCEPGRTVVTYRPYGAAQHHAVDVSREAVEVRQ